MSDPKHPVDPLAQTHAALPQSDAGATRATSSGVGQAPYAAPQPGVPSYAEQLAAHHAQQAQHAPPPPPRRSATPWIIAAVLVTGAAAAIGFVVTKASHSSGDKVVAKAPTEDGSGINPLLDGGAVRAGSGANGSGANGSANGSATGSASGPAGSALVLDVLAQRHVTLDPNFESELTGRRIAADALVIGVDANEVGIGPDAAATFIAHDLEGASRSGGSSKMTLHNGSRFNSASYDAVVGGHPRTYLVTEVHSSDHGVDVIRAWQWSRVVPDPTAYAAMQDGTLPTPARIDDVHADPILEAKVRAAFNDRNKYIALLSADGFSFGSAGETLEGPHVKAGFRAMNAEFKLHDGLRIVEVQPKFAYAAANVDFTNRFGTETFRVLLALYNQNGSWQILQGHWSNGFPIPGAP